MKQINIHSIDKATYPEKYVDHAFEQYKLYLEMADRISVRRQSTNSFFVTINTLLITIAGYVMAATTTETFFYLLTSVAGCLICYIWYRVVLSYKNLNSAKFKVIHLIEKELPYRLYDAEWDAVGRGKDKKLYLPFTNLEMKVPWIFMSIHLLIILYIIPWAELLCKLCQS